jgi:hypothetical protein
MRKARLVNAEAPIKDHCHCIRTAVHLARLHAGWFAVRMRAGAWVPLLVVALVPSAGLQECWQLGRKHHATERHCSAVHFRMSVCATINCG